MCTELARAYMPAKPKVQNCPEKHGEHLPPLDLYNIFQVMKWNDSK
jgi:hypothetical protein